MHIDASRTPSLRGPLLLARLLHLDHGIAWIGYTGSTGDLAQKQGHPRGRVPPTPLRTDQVAYREPGKGTSGMTAGSVTLHGRADRLLEPVERVSLGIR